MSGGGGRCGERRGHAGDIGRGGWRLRAIRQGPLRAARGLKYVLTNMGVAPETLNARGCHAAEGDPRGLAEARHGDYLAVMVFRERAAGMEHSRPPPVPAPPPWQGVRCLAVSQQALALWRRWRSAGRRAIFAV